MDSHVPPTDRLHAWSDAHETWVSRWIAAKLAEGTDLDPEDPEDPEDHDAYVFELRFAATALVSVPEMRALSRLPGEPDRPGYSWAEIDAYEILFGHVVHQGLCEGISAEAHLRHIGEFADFLGRHGIIAPNEHAQLRVTWARWSARLVEVWDEGGWYERSGQHRTQAQLDAHYAARFERETRATDRARAQKRHRAGKRDRKGQKTASGKQGARVWRARAM